MKIKNDCKYFKGDIPCLPHKSSGVHCEDCSSYKKIESRILIIKLGAAGDVIRTTPLVSKIKKLFPSAYLVWLTEFPELIPKIIDEALEYNNKNLIWLLNQKWDNVYNLDKEKGAVAIAERINAKSKFGFGMDEYGRCRPLNSFADHKFMTGIFDDISKRNEKSYLQEIFEICGFKFEGEKYVIERNNEKIIQIDHSRKIIGFNTGCGKRWSSRLWSNDYWTELALMVQNNGHNVLWLGGPDEHEQNILFKKKAGGYYFGCYPLMKFINVLHECDLIVTQVTMALHIAIALEKRIVLMNNIFNRYEFELYDLGEIIEPMDPCGCYFNPICIHNSMQQITPTIIYSAIERQLDAIGGE